MAAQALAADYEDVEDRLIADHARLVVDTRNCLAKAALANDRTVKA
ncbi:hypothetical protein [Microvirga sp. M2]